MIAKPIAFFACLLLLIKSAAAQHPVTVSNSPLLHTFYSLEDSTTNQPHQTVFGVNTGWSIYKDIIFPGTTIEGKFSFDYSFLPESTLLNCRITGGGAYNNLFFTSTLAKKWVGEKWDFIGANDFAYSMDFYVDNFINCATPNYSELEGLEFTFQQATPPHSFLWGLQWSKANVWCYWDDTKINQRAKGWIKIRQLNACMLNKQWNKIIIYGHRNNKGLYYDSLRLNNFYFALNKYVLKSALPAAWAENYLQVGFQINGNKAIRKDHQQGLDPVSIFLNNVQLEVKRR